MVGLAELGASAVSWASKQWIRAHQKARVCRYIIILTQHEDSIMNVGTQFLNADVSERRGAADLALKTLGFRVRCELLWQPENIHSMFGTALGLCYP